ncbi:hypothetical protein [Marinococcus luteus]|uniref:hypothetical protein n=1 Tax=Marinococcus luteus TaxID=1122204 RepID=UPI002ACD0205|nr:hypothetical protein [Marinococcus luteus]MDZ5784093.1 hypothetical protein [Marinococcus luteus]
MKPGCSQWTGRLGGVASYHERWRAFDHHPGWLEAFGRLKTKSQTIRNSEWTRMVTLGAGQRKFAA